MISVRCLRKIVLMCMIWANPNFATEPVSPTARDKLRENFRLKDMVITASRNIRNKHTIPSSTTVITSEDIARSTAQNVPDLIKFYAGIQVVDITANGRKTNVDIRGFGETAFSNTLALIDGRRINGSDLSGVDWTTVPLERIERIEIVRGGSSVLYGDNAVGGVINIITKKGYLKKKNNLVVGGNTGSYSMHNPWFDYSGSQLDGSLSYSINGSYFDTDGFRDNGFFRSRTAGFGLNYDGLFLLELSGGAKDDRYGLPGSIPESADPTSTNTPNNYAESEEYYVHMVPGFRFHENGSFRIAFDYRLSKQFSDFRDFNTVSEFDIREWGLSPQLDTEFKLANLNNRFKIGVDVFSSELRTKGSSGKSDTRGSYAIYLHDLTSITDTIFLDIGYRFNRVEYDFENSEDNHHNIDAGSIGLTWNYAEASKIFFSYDRSYRTQLLDELGGPSFSEPLKPQTSDQFQLGISHSYPIGLQSSVTLFEINSKDEILFDSNLLTPGALFPGQNVNYEETHRIGIELELNQKLGQWGSVFANFTWMDAELNGGPYVENKIPGVPERHGSVGVTLKPIQYVTLDIRSRWVENKILISDWQNNVDWNDSYFVTDTKLSFAWSFMTLYAGINNIFDEEYSEFGSFDQFKLSGSTVAVLPSPERNFIFGVTYRQSF